jgi:hypothetical protein
VPGCMLLTCFWELIANIRVVCLYSSIKASAEAFVVSSTIRTNGVKKKNL